MVGRETDASSFIAILRPLADNGHGRLLVEDASITRYYLPAGSQWQRWSSTRNITLPSGASTGGPVDSASVAEVGNVAVVPYGTEVIGQGTYVIWRYEPKR